MKGSPIYITAAINLIEEINLAGDTCCDQAAP